MSSHHLYAANIPTQLQVNVTNVYYEYIELCQGINEGDVMAVEDFLDDHPDAVDAWVNLYETPLLKACACEKFRIVKEILRHMTPEQMLPKLSPGMSYHTPLTVVAANGNMKIAEALLAENPNLIENPGFRMKLPVVVAVEKRQKEMARYLYFRTPVHVLLDQGGYHGTELFVNAIFYEMLDIALDLFGKCSRLAFTEHPQVKWIPITLLASNLHLYIGGCQYLRPFGRFIYSWIQVELPILQEVTHIKKDTLLSKLLKCLLQWTGIDDVYKLKVMHLQVKKLLLGISKETLAMGLEERSMAVDDALRFAVRYGNVEFLVEMVKNNPELLLSTQNSSSGDLFLLAIKYRQKEVLNFLYGLKQRHLLLTEDHWDGSGVLHLASSMAPLERLVTIAGAALQMQSELKWFLEIERIAPPALEKDRSSFLKDNPYELFVNEHQELRKEAEKSMKDMAGSCSLVAALIVTVTFAAIFTVPGGTDDNKEGRPFHLKDRRFKIFIVSDMISCFTACTSVLIFLGILTSRYHFDDFVVSLPAKMIAGLSLMFVSIAAMLTAFWSALFTTLNQRSWIVAPVILVACFPAILFVQLQYPLLKDMIVSTYGKGILHRNNRSTGVRARTFIRKVLRSRNKFLTCARGLNSND